MRQRAPPRSPPAKQAEQERLPRDTRQASSCVAPVRGVQTVGGWAGGGRLSRPSVGVTVMGILLLFWEASPDACRVAGAQSGNFLGCAAAGRDDAVSRTDGRAVDTHHTACAPVSERPAEIFPAERCPRPEAQPSPATWSRCRRTT